MGIDKRPVERIAHDKESGIVYRYKAADDGGITLDDPKLEDSGERVKLSSQGWTWVTDEGVRHTWKRRWPAVRAAAMRPIFRLRSEPPRGEHPK